MALGPPVVVERVSALREERDRTPRERSEPAGEEGRLVPKLARVKARGKWKPLDAGPGPVGAPLLLLLLAVAGGELVVAAERLGELAGGEWVPDAPGTAEEEVDDASEDEDDAFQNLDFSMCCCNLLPVAEVPLYRAG